MRRRLAIRTAMPSRPMPRATVDGPPVRSRLGRPPRTSLADQSDVDNVLLAVRLGAKTLCRLVCS